MSHSPSRSKPGAVEFHHEPPRFIDEWRILLMKKAISAAAFCSILLLAPYYSVHALTTDNAVRAMKKGDFETALEELRPLIEKHDPHAQFLMGMLYDAGNGVAQDQAIAASWYRKAADQNHPIAQLFSGILYYSGNGIEKDYKKAAHWLQASANHGNDQAQFYLGSMYARGDGVNKDDSKAIEWLTKASAQQNTRAMGMLAMLLFSRNHNEQDLIHAYVWSHLAAEYDPVQATTSARVLIAEYCTKTQIQAGKKLIAEWKRKWKSAPTN
jgi:TPR repeat protein